MERTTRGIVFLAAALGLIAAGAHAGLGDRIKSAKDKAAKVTGQKPAESGRVTPRKVQFDDTVIELTGPLLDKLIASRGKADAGPLKERPALVRRQGEIKAEIEALGNKHNEAIGEIENKRGNARECMSAELREIKNRKWEAMQQQMMANPASAEKLAKLAAAMNDAQM